MNAAVVHAFGEPSRIKHFPIREPSAGQIVVRTETSGLDHTDIHAAHSDGPVKPSLLFVPEHEDVGPVDRIGADVREVHERERGAVPWLGWACGAREYCASGWETLCVQQHNTGYFVNGGFVEYIRADAAFVGHVPDAIHVLDAAALTCAGVRPITQ